MHIILKVFTLTIVLVVTVCGLETHTGDILGRSIIRTTSTHVLDGEARRRKHHYFLYPYYGWHALTWIYWIKVKLVVVAFFAYTAFIWAVRYMGAYYNKCTDAGHHHVYYEHGHYRSLTALDVPKSLQTFRKERRKRSMSARKVFLKEKPYNKKK